MCSAVLAAPPHNQLENYEEGKPEGMFWEEVGEEEEEEEMCTGGNVASPKNKDFRTFWDRATELHVPSNQREKKKPNVEIFCTWTKVD